MPIRAIDTRLGRLIECRRHLLARPGRPLPKGPATPPGDDERGPRVGPVVDERPFDVVAVQSERGSHD
jgi:hypothetical protein